MASKSSVRVAVAVRPLSDKELENGDARVVWTQDDEVRVLNPENGNEKVFKFDHTVSLTKFSLVATISSQPCHLRS